MFENIFLSLFGRKRIDLPSIPLIEKLVDPPIKIRKQQINNNWPLSGLILEPRKPRSED